MTLVDMKSNLWQHGQTQRIIRPLHACAQSVKMTLHPSAKAVTFNCLKLRYGTPNFQDALADFIAQANYPRARGNTLRKYAENTLIPFR